MDTSTTEPIRHIFVQPRNLLSMSVQFMRSLAALVLVLTVGARAFAQSNADPVVISAGGITIRQSEFEHAISTLPANYQTYARGAGKRQFAEDYLRMRLLADAGMKAGLATDPNVVRQLEMLRNNVIANAYLKAFETDLYARAREKYQTSADDGRLYMRHIQIGYAGSGGTAPGKQELTEQQAKAKADALYAQIVAGANFEEIARRESDDVSSGKNGGDLGVFIAGQHVEAIDKAVRATPPGQIAPVTRSQFGYHIIMVERRGASGAAQVDEARAKQDQQTLLKAELAKLVANANPIYSNAYFDVGDRTAAPAASGSAGASAPPPAEATGGTADECFAIVDTGSGNVRLENRCNEHRVEAIVILDATNVGRPRYRKLTRQVVGALGHSQQWAATLRPVIAKTCRGSFRSKSNMTFEESNDPASFECVR